MAFQKITQREINGFDLLFCEYKIDQRFLRYVSASLKVGIDFKNQSTNYIKNQICQEMSERNIQISSLKYDLDRYVNSNKIDDCEFNFIKESKFEEYICNDAINYHINHLEYRNSIFNSRKSILSGEDSLNLIFKNISFHFRDKFIFFFDAWDVDFNSKMKSLVLFKSFFISALDFYKKFDWFSDDEKKLEAAYDHLKKSDPECMCFQSHEDLKIYIFKKFDKNRSEVELILKKIKTLYNNRKSRSQKSTKQFNLSLSEAAIKNIIKLSSTYGADRSKTIDIIFRNPKLISHINDFLKNQSIYNSNFDPSNKIDFYN